VQELLPFFYGSGTSKTCISGFFSCISAYYNSFRYLKTISYSAIVSCWPEDLTQLLLYLDWSLETDLSENRLCLYIALCKMPWYLWPVSHVYFMF